MEDQCPWDAPVEVPLNGILDLHAFQPREALAAVDATIEACIEKGIFDLRVIHGKGRGVLRNQVTAFLSAHPSVASYQTAPIDAGGWGATLVRLKRTPTNDS